MTSIEEICRKAADSKGVPLLLNNGYCSIAAGKVDCEYAKKNCGGYLCLYKQKIVSEFSN